MTRFTARAFRRKISRKNKKSRRQTQRRRRVQRGGNTFSRAIPPAAVLANPLKEGDEYKGNNAGIL